MLALGQLANEDASDVAASVYPDPTEAAHNHWTFKFNIGTQKPLGSLAVQEPQDDDDSSFGADLESIQAGNMDSAFMEAFSSDEAIDDDDLLDNHLSSHQNHALLLRRGDFAQFLASYNVVLAPSRFSRTQLPHEAGVAEGNSRNTATFQLFACPWQAHGPCYY